MPHWEPHVQYHAAVPGGCDIHPLTWNPCSSLQNGSYDFSSWRTSKGLRGSATRPCSIDLDILLVSTTSLELSRLSYPDCAYVAQLRDFIVDTIFARLQDSVQTCKPTHSKHANLRTAAKLRSDGRSCIDMLLFKHQRHPEWIVVKQKRIAQVTFDLKAVDGASVTATCKVERKFAEADDGVTKGPILINDLQYADTVDFLLEGLTWQDERDGHMDREGVDMVSGKVDLRGWQSGTRPEGPCPRLVPAHYRRQAGPRTACAQALAAKLRII